MRAALLIISVILIMRCSISGTQDHLNIAVASSLLLPLQEIEIEFERKNNCEVEFISASSGSLTTQMLNGAPYDLFIAANLDYPTLLSEAELTTDDPLIALNGSVYFWSSVKVGKGELIEKLGSGDFNQVAISNPELAPFGQTARDWLIRNRIWDSLQSSLVFGNSVGQVNHYISLNSVDAAFSSNSAAFSGELKSEGFWTPVEGPDIALVPYFYVILKESDSKLMAQKFIDFLSDEMSLEILESYGFAIDE